MADQIEQGDFLEIDLEFRNYAGGTLIDPDRFTVSHTSPAGVTVVYTYHLGTLIDPQITKVSVGRYLLGITALGEAANKITVVSISLGKQKTARWSFHVAAD